MYTDSVSVVLHLLQVQVANVSSLNFELFLKRYICIHNIHIQLNASMCVLNNGPVDDNDSLFFSSPYSSYHRFREWRSLLLAVVMHVSLQLQGAYPPLTAASVPRLVKAWLVAGTGTLLAGLFIFLSGWPVVNRLRCRASRRKQLRTIITTLKKKTSQE